MGILVDSVAYTEPTIPPKTAATTAPTPKKPAKTTEIHQMPFLREEI